MKSRTKSGSLFGLLTRNYLLFTLVLLLIAGGVYLAWNAKLDSVYAETDWDAVAADPALAAGDYKALSAQLTGGGILAVEDAAGKTLYCSNEKYDVRITPGELECVPLYGENSYIETSELTQDGAKRYLVTRVAYAADGASREQSMVLNANYMVVSGGLGDGRTGYTKSEFEYLTGKKPAGYELYKKSFMSESGSQLTALFFRRTWSAEEYQRQYENAWRVWLLFIPLYICAAGLFIWWLDRRIRRPLETLNAAVLAQAEGHPVTAVYGGGPAEIRRIGESFDKLSAQLAQSEAERKRLDEGRQKLIADISHDLRTPVTVISGYADAICDGKVKPEEQQQYLRAISGKAAALSEPINEFHEYSKTEHPDFNLHLKPTDVCEFSREYLAEKYDEVELAGFTLRLDIPEKPIYCNIDGFQFRRVLDNIISNSLRHNRLGTILYYDVSARDGSVFIAVADNGDGIPKEKAADIFEPFTVGDESRSGGGSGLGLAITRSIVEKHGGSITLSANPPAGRSTQFVITLPRNK